MNNDDVIKVIGDELEALRKRIVDNHIQAGQKASGKTITSMHVVMSDSGGALLGRKAFGTLELGRNGGRVPKGFYQIIKQWVIDKGIQVEKPNTFAYFVARKIANEGTALFRNGGRNDIYSKEIEVTIKNIMDKILWILRDDIEHININLSKNENDKSR